MPIGRNICQRVPDLFSIYRRSSDGEVESNISGGSKRLSRDEALLMFQKEFQVNEGQAELMFQHFDVDCNSYLSQWECQHLLDVFTDGTVKLYESLCDSNNVCSIESCQNWAKEILPETKLPTKQFDFQIKVLKDQSADDNNNGVDLIKFAEFKMRMVSLSKNSKKINK